MSARLWPVCPASGDSFTSYAGASRKDDQDRAPCPVCCKVVKLRKQAGERWPNTIPHHHATPNEEILERMRRRDAEASAPVADEPAFYINPRIINTATGKIDSHVSGAITWDSKQGAAWSMPVYLSGRPASAPVAVPLWRSMDTDPPKETGRYCVGHRGDFFGHAFYTARKGDTHYPVGWSQVPAWRPSHWLDAPYIGDGYPAAPKASEAVCSCPSGDGSLRHPCPVHPARVTVEFGDIGCAGPFPVVDGRVVMPPVTLTDLAYRMAGASVAVAWMSDAGLESLRKFGQASVVGAESSDFKHPMSFAPSSHANDAGILASDNPADVVRKLDDAWSKSND